MSAQRTAHLSDVRQREPSAVARLLTPRTRGIILRQIFLQFFLLLMTAIVLFPALWIVSMAVDPRGVTRPTDLVLIPPNATLDAFTRLLTQPFSNVLPMYFGQLLMNSLFIALGVSLFSVVLGSSAAYAFSRFKFIGRQAGMLGFIVLLLLPTTGVVIPLYILFTSIQVNTVLVEALRTFFASGLIAATIWVVYRIVASFGKHDPERQINPPPIVVAGGTVLALLAVIALVFLILFQRSELYANVIEKPLAVLQENLAQTEADYSKRVTSVQQRDTTATRAEQRAAAAADAVTALQALQTQIAGLQTKDQIMAVVQPEIDTRQAAAGAADDMVLQTLQTALPSLDTSVDDFKTALATGITDAQANATKLQDRATSARNNADEAAASLPASQAALNAAQADFDANAASTLGLRDRAMVAVLPYILLAWVGGLAAGAVLWGIAYALRNRLEPRALVNVYGWAVMLSVFVGFGLIGLQGYVGSETDLTATQSLRTTLLGLALAFASGGLPFAIWNLKGYFDTIPKELEEAALIDGAGLFGTFIRIMIPLSLPAFAIVILFSFMNGWTEFILSWIFLTGKTDSYTLAMALATMTGGANTAPPDMQKFAALSILISIPIMVLFFGFQRWIVSGLAIGGVKG